MDDQMDELSGRLSARELNELNRQVNRGRSRSWFQYLWLRAGYLRLRVRRSLKPSPAALRRRRLRRQAKQQRWLEREDRRMVLVDRREGRAWAKVRRRRELDLRRLERGRRRQDQAR